MDTENDKVVTEKRVTKKVIRRRAKTKTEPAPEEIKADAVEAPEVSVPETEPAAPEAPAEKIEAPARVETPKVLTKVAQPVVEEKAVEPEKKPEPVDDGLNQGYSKLKVLTKKQSEPELKITSFPTDEERRKAQEEMTGRQAPSLTKKEIIDVRNMHRPKGGRKRKQAPGKQGKKTEITVPKAAKRVVKIGEAVSVQELAKNMSVKGTDLIKKLMGMGMMATINQTLDAETAMLVATEFGYEVESVKVAPEDLLVAVEKDVEANAEDVIIRPPVVTVMGHVDHGKTSLLDAIRKSDVAAGEAGGITQHIGAYTIQTGSGHKITFIDTPGHESFTAMRARGAQVTDIVILVVAADDGVMPQTKEAVSHAKSAGVPLIVAINKMDKPGADVERIKKELTEFELVPEEWGGETIYAPVSAIKGEGIDALLEHVYLQSEMMELKANPKRLAKGVIIESRVDKGRGAIITVLVREGTLRVGENIISGSQFGRVRDMRDEKGMRLKEAGPSQAVEIAGFSGVPSAGEELIAVADEKKAKQIAEMRKNIDREKELAASSKVSLDDLYSKIALGDVKELNVIIKADTDGSVEVLKDSVAKLSTKKVVVKVIHGAVGGITENDVLLATASGALVVGFNVRPQSTAKKLAEQKSIDIRLYKIIYELQEDLTKAMAGLLAPKQVEEKLGMAEVLEVYTIGKVGTIAGCLVQEGRVARSAKVRLVRGTEEVFSGELESLKRFKDDAKEVKSGTECGIQIKGFNDIQVGDKIEAFTITEVAAELE